METALWLPPAAAARKAAVVAVVVLVAACGNGQGDDLPAVEGETAPELEVRATEMAYDPDEIAVPAGTVEVVLHNEGAVLHDLRIQDQPFVVEAAAGETATARVVLEPGRYRFFCSLPGHREAGMEGVVEVR